MSSEIFNSVTPLNGFIVDVDFVEGAFFTLLSAAKVYEFGFGLIEFESYCIHPLTLSIDFSMIAMVSDSVLQLMFPGLNGFPIEWLST